MPGPIHGSLVRELAQKPGGTWVSCAGRSMEPTIELGDRVRIEACSPARVRAGDIVLIESPGGHVLHRVVFCIPATGWLLHIGDSEACRAPGVAHTSQLIGRAALPRRLAGPGAFWAGALHVARALARRVIVRG